jgi:hypothetical protein
VRAGTLPHRASYLAVAGDIEGGARSLTEIDFRLLARLAGLPTPRGQAVRLDRLGRRRYLDADFGTFAVEVDGPTLRFPLVGIYLQRDRVVDQLRAAGQRWL